MDINRCNRNHRNLNSCWNCNENFCLNSQFCNRRNNCHCNFIKICSLESFIQFKFNKIMCFGGSLLLILCVILTLTKINAKNYINQNNSDVNDDVNGLLVTLPDLGVIQGSITRTAWTDQIIFQFLGIPFSEPPNGEFRFKPPRRKKPWKGILSAVKHKHPCPNSHLLNTLLRKDLEIPESDLEDCLNIAVYTKNLHTKYPVMVYIHGGGFYNGSAIDHPPNHLLEKDIVLVVPQYRLCAFGFLSTQSTLIPGNAAVLDLILSLKWIQKYIKFFGGDPNEVTIFGQSAGSALINVLMYSPEVPSGLFKRVINQSGSFLSGWAFELNPIDTARKICEKLNCSSCENVEFINQCLINAPLKYLLSDSIEQSSGLYKLTVGDKYNILPKTPLELMKTVERKYPMIGGVTKHEGTFVLAVFYDALKAVFGDLNTLNSHQIIDKMIDVCHAEDDFGLIGNMAKKLLFTHEQLTSKNFTKLIPGLVDLSSVLVIKGSVLRLLQLHAKSNPNSTYLYTFDYEGQYTRFGYETNTEHYPFNGGVSHSNDNLYVFPKYKLNERDTEMAKKLVDIWTSFATTGIPSANGLTDWKPITEVTGPYLHINEHFSIGEDFLDEYLVTVNDPIKQIIKGER